MLDQLAQLGLAGMAQAFAELEASGEGATLTHADWLGLLVDREITHRRDKRLAARLRYARLRHQAAVEDVDYRAPRGLDRGLFHKLAGGEWIDAHDNLILCGPTGVGKSWLACALGHKACRDNRSVLYQRVPKLFADLALAHGDGRYAHIMRSLNGVQLLILDDWGLERRWCTWTAWSTEARYAILCRGIPMPHKHNDDRRHHIPKMAFKVQNWPEYEAGLRRRGSLTLWIEDAALDHWQTVGPKGQPAIPTLRSRPR